MAAPVNASTDTLSYMGGVRHLRVPPLWVGLYVTKEERLLFEKRTQDFCWASRTRRLSGVG
jgi:hypothetical protein